MAWVYIPNCTTSLSAQGGADLITESSWQFQTLAQLCVSRGKHSPSRNWWRRWNKAFWLKHLCSRMCEPSTADRGAALWMESLVVSRVRRTHWLEKNSDHLMSETSGVRRAVSSPSLAPSSCSLKMLAGCSALGLTKSLEQNEYGETYESWVSRLRADCSRRQKSARATNGNESSSSAWPTMRCGDGAMSPLRENVKNARGRIEDAVAIFTQKGWPTPTANDWKGSGPTLERSDGKMRGDRLDYATEQLWYTPNVPNGGRVLSEDTSPTGMTPEGIKRQVGLENQAKQWATPRGKEDGQYQYSRGDKTKPVQTLTGQSMTWNTPQARDHFPPHSPEYIARKKAQGHGMANLNDQVDAWSTPRATDGEKGGPNQQFGAGGVPLPSQAAQWPTPTSLSFGESHQPGNSRSYNKTMEMASFLPDQETEMHGEKSSKERRTLNPRFVAWLMGWPQPASTGLGFSEMGLSIFKPLMRSAFLQLGLPQEAPPQQLSLFG